MALLRYCLSEQQPPKPSQQCTLHQKGNKTNVFGPYFFAPQRESGSIYYKLLEIHTLDNVFNSRMASFIYKFKNFPDNTPGVFHNIIIPASRIHSYYTRYASRENLYKDQCPEPIMRFQDLRQRLLEFRKMYHIM